jgi:hypothetical protein
LKKCFLLHAGLLLELLVNPEDRGSMFLRNVGRLSKDCKTLYSKHGTLQANNATNKSHQVAAQAVTVTVVYR